ncbi:hypothetical protein MTBPR1_10447 [Candidatus Terasakiella magnetica]|uniref:Uncharacterized protein n=2 Tax=Candidatus Terasakiella magnetica TaxID=1867952 RepID=A0A1C3RD36_9PROT|nr:hypothetical protein MTBPR1_10447 [Candidatus Terasakiella magnetica]
MQVEGLKKALEHSENRLGEMMGNLPVTLFRLRMDKSGDISFPYISAGSAALMGADSEALLKEPKNFLTILDAKDRYKLLRRLVQSAHRKTPFDEEVCLHVSALNKVWVRVFANIHDSNADETIWDGAAIDITGQHLLDERLRYLAYHEETTQLPNRLAMEEHLNELFDSVDETPFAILALAIDRLDLVNDTLGLETANRLVTTVAEHLQKSLPHGTFLSHPRAESFCIVWQDFCDDKDVAAVADKLLQTMKIPFQVGTRRLDISVSMGISLAYKDAEDAENLMMNADTALRRAHLTSPGGYRFYVEEMNTRALRVLAYENRLRKAINSEEFVPFFQPLVDVKTGQIASMEALARWKHPRLGLIGPGEFVPVAEEAGLIGEICHQILHSTCATAKKWLDEGHKPLPLAVNISWRQFAQPERLLLLMSRVLDETGMPAELIELELTESSVMEEPDSAIRTLNDLREFGVQASIDDFGTGYSSLSYLKRLPISKLKIDRAFINEVNHNERDAAIVEAIIQLARALGLKTVAEGIETQEQFEFLREKGCDLAQGFYFSKPVPAHEMEKMLIKGGFSLP